MTHVLQTSERMLAAARSGDWDTTSALEAERSEAIAALDMSANGALELIKTLLAHTEEVRGLATEQRDRVNVDLQQHPHRHRALSAYLHAGIAE